MYIGNSGSASVQPGILLINMQFHKNPYLPHGGSLEILKGMGWGLKSQDMKPNWNFQRAFLSGGGGGTQTKKTSMGGVWIFSETTQWIPAICQGRKTKMLQGLLSR